MYFQEVSKIIYIQQNTIMILKWTENRNVNQAGSLFLLSKQLLLDGLYYYLHQPKDYSGPNTTWDKKRALPVGGWV